MISNAACRTALRNRAIALSVATTGAITMSATATGYTRTPIAGTGTLAANAGVGTFNTSQAGVIVNGSVVTVAGTNYIVSHFDGTTGCTLSGAPTFGAAAFTYTGSFIVDGLTAGMEIVPTGFGTNPVGTISSVTARTVTTAARSVEASASGRTLAVGLPQLRDWENADITFERVAGRLYVTEEYSPSTHSLYASPKQGGDVEETGMYVLKVFGISGTGTDAIDRYVDGLRALFAPGTQLTAGADTVRIRADVAPSSSAVIPQGDGWTVCALPIHWSANSKNVIV